MKFSQNSFVYRVAFPEQRFWQGYYRGDVWHEKPKEANTRAFFLRFLPILIVVPFMFVFGFLTGRRPGIFHGDDFELDPWRGFVSYRRWPRIRGHRVWPIMFATIAMAGWSTWEVLIAETAGMGAIIIFIVVAFMLGAFPFLREIKKPRY